MVIVRDEKKRAQIIELLTQAYWMGIETTMSYIANSINPDGVRAEEVKKSSKDCSIMHIRFGRCTPP